MTAGQRPAPFRSINLACLDDADASELAAAPVRFMDGRNNNR
jgi:hypothetical protein